MMSWSPLETSTNGFMEDHTNKELSLREKKQMQWSKEKADSHEWFPFGKPGAGAPLKPTRSRKNSSSSNAVSIPGSHQLNGVNHDHQALDQKSMLGSISGSVNVSNGHHHNQQQSAPVAQSQYSSPQTNGNNNIPYGYVPSISTQPSYLPYYQAFPGAIAVPFQHANGFVGSPINASPSGANVPLSQMPPQYYQQSPNSYYAMPPAGYAIIQQQNQQTFGHHVVTNGLPINAPPEHQNGTAGQQTTPQDVNGRGSMTASSLTEPSCHVAKQNPQDPSAIELSYTEQWASQLPVWQQMEQRPIVKDPQPPNTLPIAQQYGPNDNVVGVNSVNSVPVQMMSSSVMVNNNNTPDSHHFVPTIMSSPIQMTANFNSQSSAPTAWVSPMSHNGVPHQPIHAQRTAIVSPLHSKAPSLCGNDTIEMMSSSFSGAIPNKSNSLDDFGIHKRRHQITNPTELEELEERQQRVNETKMAIEEQIAQKRRQQLVDAEKERQEIERLERERRLLELRESRENEHERNKWKELMEEEQRREAAIRDALEKARLEAKVNRKAKLLQHAWSGKRSDSEELDSLPYSHPAPAQEQTVSGQVLTALTIVSVNSGSSGSVVSGQPVQRPHRSPPPSSVVGSSLETNRSQSLPPLQHYITPTAPTDDRPIKPLTVDPLKLWEQFAKDPENQVDDNNERVPRRDAPVRQSLRKSRSIEASRIAASRRAESLERKDKIANNDLTPKSTLVNSKKTVSKLKEPENNRRSEIKQPESRMASAATYIVRRDIFAPTGKLEISLNNGHVMPASEEKPPVPARRDKERKKSKSKDSMQKEFDPNDNQDRQKLLQRRSSADRVILTKNVEDNLELDNPWGDQLGGLNPLLQPLSTRSRKKSRILSVNSAPDTNLSPSQSNLAINNGSPKESSESMSDLVVSSSTDSSKNDAKVSSDEKLSSKTNKEKEKEHVQSPNLERFNFRSPLYSSFSAKIKQPNERQSDVLKQLCKLKEQLKKSQKDVEETLRLKTPFLQNGKNL